MKTALLVDGTYFATATARPHPLATLGRLVRAISHQGTAPFSRCIYFDINVDIDAALSSPMAARLRPLEGTELHFELRVHPVARTADGAYLTGDAHQLLVAEMAVSAISSVLFEDVERLVIAAGDAALEPSIAMLRDRGLRELWHAAHRTSCSPALRAHADQTIWLDELQ